MLLAAAAVAVAFSFVVNNPVRIILPTGLLSVAAFAVFRVGNATHFGTVWSTAFASFAVGIAAVFCTQWFKAPAAAFATCAILPMLPGLTLYRALSATSHTYAGNLQFLAQAMSIALALAAAMSFGEYLAIGAQRQLRVVERRFLPEPRHRRPREAKRRQPNTWSHAA